MTKKKLIFVCIFILFALGFFIYIVEKDEAISNKIMVESNTMPVIENHNYYMKFQDRQFVIYNKDHSIYELADLEEKFLPASLVNELKEGKYFKDEQELYEFLETYTS